MRKLHIHRYYWMDKSQEGVSYRLKYAQKGMVSRSLIRCAAERMPKDTIARRLL